MIEEMDERLPPPWHPWEAFPVGLAATAVTFLAFIGVTAAFGGQGGPAVLITAIISQATFVLLTVVWIAVRHPGTVSALGLRSRRPPGDVAIGAWVGAGLHGAALFLILPVLVVLWRVVTGSPPDPIDQGILPVDPAGAELALGLVAVVIAAPIGEEVFFRGFLFGALRARLGFVRAAIISSAVFGLFHIEPLLIAVMFFVGLGLATLYERRGALLAPMAAHAMFNIIGYTLLIMERT
jgi:hypothetical protein